MLKKDYLLSVDKTRNLDSDGTASSVVGHIALTFERMVMYLFDICSFDIVVSNFTFIIQWMIITLQLIRFLGDAYISYQWNSAVPSVVMQIADFVTEIPFASLFTAYVLTVCLLFTIIGLAVFTCLTHNYNGWAAPLRAMRMVLVWIPTLYFPILIPHLKLMLPCLSYSPGSHTAHPFYADMTCWRGGYVGYFVLSLLVAVGVWLVTYLTSVCFYNHMMPQGRMVRKYPLNSKYTSTSDTALLLTKTVLLILSIAGHDSTWRLAMGALTFLFGAAATIHLIWRMPWWHDVAMLLYIFQSLVLTWTGLVSLFLVAFDDAEGTGMLYFVMLPVLAIAAQMLLQWRMEVVSSLREEDLRHPALVMVKVRGLARMYFQWLLQFGDIYIEASEAQENALKQCLDLVETTLELGGERFPESADLCLFAAQYYMSINVNRVLAYRSLSRIESALHLSLEHRFHNQATLSALREVTYMEQSEEVRDYTEFKARRPLADKAVSDAMRSLIILWTEMMQPRPDIDKLSTTGERARTYLDSATRHYERLLQINPHNVPVLRVYAVLCLEILGDLGRAQQLFHQADVIVNTKKKMMLDYNYGLFLREISVKPDIFDEDNAIVGISINTETLGEVESVNPAFLRILGFGSSKDIVGKNIAMILPEPVKTHHDRYMKDYLVTRRSVVINHTRMVMAVHAMGYLTPLAMHVRWSDEALGKIIAVMQPISNSYETCLVVDPKTMAVTAATANFATVFGYSRRDILANRIKLFDVLPALKDDDAARGVNEEIYSQLASTRGHDTFGEHMLTRQLFRLHCYLTHVMVYEDSFYFLRCQVSQIQGEEESDYVSEAESEEEREITSDTTRYASSAAVATPDAALADNVRAVLGQDTATTSGVVEDDDAAATSTPCSERASPLSSMRNSTANTTPNDKDNSARNAPHSARSLPASARLVPHLKLMVDDAPSRADSSSLSARDAVDSSPVFTPSMALPASPVYSVHEGTTLLGAYAPTHAAVATTATITAAAGADASAVATTTSVVSPSSGVSSTIALGEDAQGTDMGTLQSSGIAALHGRSSPTHADLRSPASSGMEHAVTEATSANGPVAGSAPVLGVGSSELLQRRRRHAQKRLKKAIENDNSRTVRRLGIFSAVGLINILVVLACILGDFFMSNADVSHTDALINNVYLASMRHTISTYIGINFFIHHDIFLRNPASPALAMVFYRPLVHENATAAAIQHTASTRVASLLEDFASNSMQVDSMTTDSEDRKQLRAEDVLPFLARTPLTPAKYHYITMSLRNLVSYIGAMTSWSMFEQKASTLDDYGQFFVVSNIANRAIPEAFEKDVEYTVVEVRDRHVYMTTVTVYFFVATLVSVMLIASLLLLPMLVQIEKTKARVLDVFLSVPQNVRKVLRRKAVRVYRLVEEVEANMHEGDGDDEDEGDQNDYVASTRGSDANSLAHAASVLSGGGDDAYAAMFKRYSNIRELNDGLSGGESKEEENQHVHRSRRVDTVLKSTGTRPAREAEDMATRVPRNAGTKQRIDATGGPDDMSLLSGLSGDALSRASTATLSNREAHAKARYNVWGGGAMRVAGVRFLLFMLLVVAYFTILIVETSTYTDTMHTRVRRVAMSGLRNPRITLALYYTINHLFFNKAELISKDPLDPSIHAPGTFAEEGVVSIMEAGAAFRSLVFGDGELIHGALTNPLQRRITFEDLCEMDEHLLAAYPTAAEFPYLMEQCTEAHGGINTKGLYATYLYIEEQFRLLLQPQYNKAFAHYITGEPSSWDEATLTQLNEAFDAVFQLFNDFTYHHMLYSDAVFRSTALDQSVQYNTVRYILVGFGITFVLLSFFILVRPTSIILARSCAQANAMMLLLPAQILRHVPAAQKYVQENISSD